MPLTTDDFVKVILDLTALCTKLNQELNETQAILRGQREAMQKMKQAQAASSPSPENEHA